MEAPVCALADVVDDVLGPLTYDADIDCWEASVSTGIRTLRFAIAGDEHPDPGLLTHARQVTAEPGQLYDKVTSFLEEEAVRLPTWKGLPVLARPSR